MKRAATIFLGAHVVALALGIFGLLSAVPNPGQFASNPLAMAFFGWAIVNVGTVDIWTGTLAMLAFGWTAIGPRRTAAFRARRDLHLGSRRTDGNQDRLAFRGLRVPGFLGLKLAGRVPYTVPLSWFYMGFASFLLATKIVQNARLRNVTLWSIALGAWLLMAWDLVLDPAMASDKLTTWHFWIWKEHGAYFGMPLRNLAGWLGTGLTFMAVGRALWRGELRPAPRFATPALHRVCGQRRVGDAAELERRSLATALAAIVFSLVPAAIALRPPERVAPLPA